mmetsp:Transcript_28816/g.49814  ORF Transcript_28816/g.49814 Transcript_28816/m.49814 type:complete len:354 (+) Transcript_28816:68-1129(+)
MYTLQVFTLMLTSWLVFLANLPGMRAAHTSTSSCTYCETDGSSAEYTFDTTSDDDFVIITSNLCPDHIHENQVGENPNSACVQDDETFYLPKVPVWRDDSGGDNTNNYYALGIMALAISNVALYGPATGPTGGDAGDEEIDTFDYCGAHADPDSVYHYHIGPYCLNLAANATEVGTILNPSALHSPLWGWSPDGFPYYGPYGDDGEAPDDLDDCQGHYGDSGAGGGYHYHYNAGPLGPYPQDSNEDGGYPYYQGCIRGCVPDEHSLADDLQEESYSSCVASSSAAPAGNYSVAFYSEFTGLDYDGIDSGDTTDDTSGGESTTTDDETSTANLFYSWGSACGLGIFSMLLPAFL